MAITTESIPNLSAYASNNGGGFVQIGNASATITFNNTTVGTNTVGGGAVVVTGTLSVGKWPSPGLLLLK